MKKFLTWKRNEIDNERSLVFAFLGRSFQVLQPVH